MSQVKNWKIYSCELDYGVKQEILTILSPAESFGLTFIPNQFDLFRNLYPSQTELIRVNPKKVFNLVWCKSVENLWCETHSQCVSLASPRVPLKLSFLHSHAVNLQTPRTFRYITAHLTTLEKHYSQRVNISGGSCIANASLHSAIAMSTQIFDTHSF